MVKHGNTIVYGSAEFLHTPGLKEEDPSLDSEIATLRMAII